MAIFRYDGETEAMIACDDKADDEVVEDSKSDWDDENTPRKKI